MPAKELLIPGQLSLAQLRRLCAPVPSTVRLDAACRAGVRASAALVHQAASGGAAVYGVNTGFGKLANTRIAKKDLAILQLKLLRSHAVGVGEPLPTRVVHLVLLLKAASLARGYSGVREEVIDALLALHNHGICPVIPCQGSVGASGDLAPLAHLCLPLVGEGEVFYQEQRLPAARALALAGLQPLALSAKEGLALINGTQVSTALALDALFATERLFETAVISGALTLHAARGSDGPFDPRIHAVRGQPGQIACAAAYRALMVGSEIRRSHLDNDDRVQDPYCLRCQPQVMGACLDQMRYRIAMLVDTVVSRLPPFLTPDAGLNSGFMIVHVTAAALASENKSLAHPASVDSLPTSANQEDHVSMATFAARRLQPMLRNTSYIVGIELLAAAQGIEFLRPLKSSTALERVLRLIRIVSPAMMEDRSLARDIEAVQHLVASGDMAAALDADLPELHALRLANTAPLAMALALA